MVKHVCSVDIIAYHFAGNIETITGLICQGVYDHCSLRAHYVSVGYIHHPDKGSILIEKKTFLLHKRDSRGWTFKIKNAYVMMEYNVK